MSYPKFALRLAIILLVLSSVPFSFGQDSTISSGSVTEGSQCKTGTQEGLQGLVRQGRHLHHHGRRA